MVIAMMLEDGDREDLGYIRRGEGWEIGLRGPEGILLDKRRQETCASCAERAEIHKSPE
jgi:hypothetical protein